MDGSQGGTWLVTGEAVPVDLRIARTGSRLVAALLDLAVELVGLFVLLFVLTRLFSSSGDPDLTTALTLVAVVGALLGYPVVCETLWRGKTLGKAAMGLRVVRDDGGPLRFRHAFARGLLGFVVEKPGVLIGIPAVVSSMVNSRAKRLGDLVAGTIVLQERVPAPPTLQVAMPPVLAGWASTVDLSTVPPGLLLSARQCLARWPTLNPGAREQLSASVATQMAAYVAPLPPAGTPAWAFLMAVLAERRRRDESATTHAPPASPLAAPPSWGAPPARPPQAWVGSAPAPFLPAPDPDPAPTPAEAEAAAPEEPRASPFTLPG